MSLFDTVAKAQALREGRAIELNTSGRFGLVENPAMLAMYALPGEDATILSVMFGFAKETTPRLVRTIMDPRNRTEQYDLFVELGDHLNAYFADAAKRQSFPQLVVSGPSSVSHILALANRTLGLRTTDETGKIDGTTLERNAVVQRTLGERLGYYRNRWETPGQQSLVPATDLLTAIWVTGQSSMEDAQLHAVRAWIDPQGRTLDDALAAAEDLASGSKPRPAFDKAVLTKERKVYHKAREAGDTQAPSDILSRTSQAVANEISPTYETIRWAIARVHAQTRPQSFALKTLGAEEVTEFHFSQTRQEEDYHIRATDGQTVRTKSFLARETMLDIVDGLFAQSDPVERARMETDGRLIRGKVLSLAPVSVLAYLPNGGPRRGDILQDLGDSQYEVRDTEIEPDGKLRITLTKLSGTRTPRVGHDVLLMSQRQDVKFLTTLRSTAKKRLGAPSWVYDASAAVPKVRREKPAVDLLTLVENGAGGPQ